MRNLRRFGDGAKFGWKYFVPFPHIFLLTVVINLSHASSSAGGPRSYQDGDLRFFNWTTKEIQRAEKVLTAPDYFHKPEPFEALSAGAASTRRRATKNAFSDPSATIPFSGELDFKVGNGLFKKLWVSSPSSTLASDGLGPLFNSRSCQSCHIKDGRGHPPLNHDDGSVSMVLGLYQLMHHEDLSNSFGVGKLYKTFPDPNYGSQIQDLSVAGLLSEGKIRVDYKQTKTMIRGEGTFWLREPTYQSSDLNYGALDPKTSVSARVAPQMIGLGLLEAIPSEQIISRADPADTDADGISGIARLIFSTEHSQYLLGRFGHKADAATIRQQVAKAAHIDLGLSNPLYSTPWGDCTESQERCLNAEHGVDDARDGLEVDEVGLQLLTFYSRNLGVPRRADVSSSNVLAGKSLFYAAKCDSCHHPKYVTHRLVDQPEQNFQLIWPYTDLLLHDMGDGLADKGANSALAREWRTAPLWGIGLTQQVSGHSYFLHDGRARNLTEAILWHGGEAKKSRDKFANMTTEERQQLLTFLKSL